MNTKVGYLLKEINILREKVEARKDAEDNFNLFSILVTRRKEEYLHSRFISVLLDPNGPHKMGTRFLDLFIQTIGSSFEYTVQSLSVRPNYENRSEHRDIDIYITSSSQAIIIENKVGAGDSNHEDRGQLEKYYEEALEELFSPESIEVFYLTHDGHVPSEESLNTTGKHPELKEKVRCITYGYEILNWLKKCVKESYDKPILRESINQYIKLIQEMTNNDMQIEERKALVELIGKTEDNLNSAKYLIDNFKHVQWHTISDFWKDLTNAFVEDGYKLVKAINSEDVTKLVHGGVRKKKQNMRLFLKTSNNIPIAINCDYDEPLCYGISYTSRRYQNSARIKEVAKKYIAEGKIGDCDEDWAFWTYFTSDGCRVVLSDFSDENSFNLISQNKRNAIIPKIVAEVNQFVADFEKMLDRQGC